MPPEVLNIPRDRPLIYFAMGSSGTPEIVARILESFEGKPYRVIAPIKFQIRQLAGVRVPSNVLATDWLPALQVNRMVDLAVIYGGIGTVMTAALAGKPVVGVGMQMEQVANLACLDRLGFAIRIRKSRDPSSKVQDVIRRLLRDEAARAKAADFARSAARWDGPKLATETLLQRYGSEGIHEFARNISIADGPNVRDFGIVFTTRMTLVKLSNASLWVSSPVVVSAATLEQIAALGPVKYLVAGTPRHVWRLAGGHAMFPDAQLWAPLPTLLTLQKGPLPLAGILENEPCREWADDLDQLAFKGNPLAQEICFFHRDSRTLMVDDLIQNKHATPGTPFRNLLFRLAGVAYPNGGVPRDMRLTFFNRKLARLSLERLLSWDFDKLILAHGVCVEHDAKPFVKRAFRWLIR